MTTYEKEEILNMLREIRGYTYDISRSKEQADFMMSKITHKINCTIREVERNE